MPARDVDSELLLEPLKRVDALERLLEGPATRGELQDELDVSRATLHRIATFLREEDLAVESDEGLELTTAGRTVTDAAVAYADRVGTATELAPLLNEVDPEMNPAPLEPELLTDVEVVLPAPGQPGRPAQRIVDAVDGADAIRGLAPVVLPIYVEAFHREILDGMDAELVVAPDVVEGLDQVYAEKLQEALDTGRIEIRVHEGVPFGLLLSEDLVALVVYDDEGVVKGTVAGDGEQLREWATDCYEHYWSTAEPLAGGTGP